MRIWNLKDARIYDGTPVEILQQMKVVETSDLRQPLDEYIAHKAHDAGHHGDVTLEVTGDTVEERAASLLSAMEHAGLVRRIA